MTMKSQRWPKPGESEALEFKATTGTRREAIETMCVFRNPRSGYEEKNTKNTTNFPPGWDEERVQRILRHYDSLTEDEAVAEDEAAFEDATQTVMEIPKELVPAVRALIADRAT